MDIGNFLTNINRFDLLAVLFLFGMFVLGFIQGTIRRLLGLASMLFSFLFAANVRDSLGSFLAANWNQFPDEYAVMIGFGTVFAAGTIAFTLIIQGFYHRQPLFEKATVVDEVLGGILGVIQGLVLIAFIIIILDSFFEIPTIAEDANELILLRPFHDFYDGSGIAALMRNNLIPAFYTLFGLFIPENLKSFYVTFR